MEVLPDRAVGRASPIHPNLMWASERIREHNARRWVARLLQSAPVVKLTDCAIIFAVDVTGRARNDCIREVRVSG